MVRYNKDVYNLAIKNDNKYKKYMINLSKILKDFGLVENEAKAYVACLELGQATVQEIGKKSGVKRTTVYIALDGLKEKGLASQTKKNKKTFFAVENPEGLLVLSQRRASALKEILPELKALNNIAGAKPKVRFYEGREGYLAVYENILNDKPKELLAIASYDDLCHHLDPEYEESWTKRRIANGIKLRWLDFKTKSVVEKAIEGERGLREVRFLPDGFRFTSSMFIYNDKIVIMSGKQKEFMAVVMENSEFHQMFGQLFEMLWQKNK